MDVFTWCVNTLNSGQQEDEISVVSASFGGGYRQFASDGINPIRRNIEIEYVGEDYKEVRKFMQEHAWQPFLFQPPGDDDGVWVVDAGSGVGLEMITESVGRVTCKFSEAF